MSHLNLRTSNQDENNLSMLINAWQLDRSEATRKALALAASMVKDKCSSSKEELIKNSKFIGSETSSEFSSTNYKHVLKQSLRKKHGI